MNLWLKFLAEFRKKNPTLSMRDAMKKGAIAWKSHKGKGKAVVKKKGRGKKKKG